jgi:hypothetical protein
MENIAEQDHRLEAAAVGSRMVLAEYRWHWTLDETNGNRNTIYRYAQIVDRDERTIRDMVRGYADYLAAPPGMGDFEESLARAKIRGNNLEATEAVAKAKGVTLETARRHHAAEISDVKAAATERAERRGTPVSEEIVAVAKDRAREQVIEKKRAAERKQKHSIRYVEMEGKIASAMRSLRYVLDETDGIEFGDEERELLVDSLAKLRALLNLLDVRLTGASDVDWDAEMIKLGDAS